MTNKDKEILLDIIDLIKVVAARSEMSNDDFSYISDTAEEIEDKLNADQRKTILEYLDDIEDIVINSFKAEHKFEDEPFTEKEYDILNALSDARAAVKFRIAKKLVNSSGTYSKLRGNIYPLQCPTCKCGFKEDSNNYRFCPNCGQSIE